MSATCLLLAMGAASASLIASDALPASGERLLGGAFCRKEVAVEAALCFTAALAPCRWLAASPLLIAVYSSMRALTCPGVGVRFKGRVHAAGS